MFEILIRQEADWQNLSQGSWLVVSDIPREVAYAR